jgi:hypothetical protein
MANDNATPQKLNLEEARSAGVKYYWSGSPCKNGHTDFRYTKGRRCLACSKQKSAEDFKRRPEYYAAKSKRWYLDKERTRKKMAAWRARNPERNKETRAKWRAAN